MEQQVRKVLASVARLAVPIAEIHTSDDLYDKGLTSLAVVNVMLGLEEEFDIEIPDDLLKRETFSSIFSLVQTIKQLSQK